MNEPAILDAERSAEARPALAGQLGVLRIAAVVIAFSAPLAVVAGYLAVVIALGNGLGAPAAFLFTGCVLLLFSVGYTELVKALPTAGGFYVYITAGLGRSLGLAGTVVALLSYFLLAAGTYAFLGLAASRLIGEELGGPSIPWWLFVAVAWLLSTVLAYRELSVSAKILSYLILLEFTLIVAFDVTVLLRGGPEGFPWQSLAPAHIFSGAPGLALLFAAGMFLGFESTAVYRDEAREPEKTIPRATFVTVGFLTLFFTATTFFLITALGASQAVAIAAEDPAKTFPLALGRELGQAAVILGYILLCTSLYGAALSMHNVLSRYVFRMAENGLIPSRLAAIDPKFRAPSKASLAAAGILGLIMLPFPIAGASPDLLYARQVGVGVFGFMLLLFMTSVAVAAYFFRQTSKIHPLRSLVAPIGSAICLFAIFALANLNFVALTGTSDAMAAAIMLLVYGTGVAGLGWAYWLKAKRPEVFAKIGSSKDQGT